MVYYRLEATLTFGNYHTVHLFSRETTSLLFGVLDWNFYDGDQCRLAFENECYIHGCHYGFDCVPRFKYMLAQNCLYESTWLKWFIFLIPPSNYHLITFEEHERDIKRVRGG